MDRRDLLKTLGVSAAALPILTRPAGADPVQPSGQDIQGPPWRGPAGTPSDPDLVRPKVTWEKVLTAGEMTTLTALCDMIIPADDRSPAASAVGVPDYINEWASAPYDYQRNTLVRIRGGLAWLNVESARRFGKDFAAATDAERAGICADICYQPKARPEHKAAAAFFDTIRDLSATGFYTTLEGMRDLGYVGNQPQPEWPGPPPEVLRHLGLE